MALKTANIKTNKTKITISKKLNLKNQKCKYKTKMLILKISISSKVKNTHIGQLSQIPESSAKIDDWYNKFNNS